MPWMNLRFWIRRFIWSWSAWWKRVRRRFIRNWHRLSVLPSKREERPFTTFSAQASPDGCIQGSTTSYLLHPLTTSPLITASPSTASRNGSASEDSNRWWSAMIGRKAFHITTSIHNVMRQSGPSLRLHRQGKVQRICRQGWTLKGVEQVKAW